MNKQMMRRVREAVLVRKAIKESKVPQVQR